MSSTRKQIQEVADVIEHRVVEARRSEIEEGFADTEQVEKRGCIAEQEMEFSDNE